LNGTFAAFGFGSVLAVFFVELAAAVFRVDDRVEPFAPDDVAFAPDAFLAAAVDFLAAAVFFAGAFLAAAVFFAGAFLAAVVFFAAAVVFAGDFLAAAFVFAADAAAVEDGFARVDVVFLAAAVVLARLDVEVVFFAGTISQGSGKRQCTGSARHDLRMGLDPPQGPIVPTCVTRSR
jgi:hypothetical protein